MEWFNWTRQTGPRWRFMMQEGAGGGHEGRSLPFARRTLGSFGRGARWFPARRGQTFKRGLAGFQDWWQMYLDQHPYRLLAAFLAAGFAAGYLAGRNSRSEESEEEIEAQAH